MRPVVVVMLGLALVGCERRPRAFTGTPEATYAAFAEALRGKEPKLAWELLSAPTRAAVEARAKTVVAAAPGMVLPDPMVMVLQSGVWPDSMGEIKVVSQTEAAAVLEVGPSERRKQVKLVKETLSEGSRWAVDLTEAFADRR